MHLDRLLGSAQQARIDTSALGKDTLKRIILETIGATERRDGVFVRYWLTAGRGDFGISPKNCAEPSFYCVVHDDSHGGNDRGLSAAPVDVPLKPPLLATAKTNNYMINALVAMEAEAKGAQLGVQFEADGHLAESSVATIAVVGKDGILVSPPADSILASTTWARVRALARHFWRSSDKPSSSFQISFPSIVASSLSHSFAAFFSAFSTSFSSGLNRSSCSSICSVSVWSSRWREFIFGVRGTGRQTPMQLWYMARTGGVRGVLRRLAEVWKPVARRSGRWGGLSRIYCRRR